jgi:hypothetical protein
MVQQFYEYLFSSEPCDSVDAVLDSIPVKVTADMNSDLCEAYTDAEIETALFQMGPMMAPGADGFPALFYQTHWEFLKEEICHVVRSFLCGSEIPEGLCDSIIVLIPKVAKPKHLKNFRPILYKIASKVLANRLKVILPNIISEQQSAFVPGRLITDNSLIAFECLHTIRNQKSKKPFFALKINMMKAYDRVEWNYLHGCLCKLGFDPSWIQSVMRCARVLKGRYFPNTDFWHAPKPRSSSYMWRSILHGRDLLVEGVRWGIVDGKTVNILSDNWIPHFQPGLFKMVSPIPSTAKVHCLLNKDS